MLCGVVCWLLRKRCKLSYPKIGEVVKRDHTTVMAACEAVEEVMEACGRAEVTRRARPAATL
jgi:chromosomal replication initiation ATPase DnaA